MKMINILLTVLMLGIQACEKQVEPIFPSDSINIVGIWQVKHISGGIAGEIYSPNFNYLHVKGNGEFTFSLDSVKIASGIITTETNSDNELLLKFNLDIEYELSVVSMSTYYAKKIRLLDPKVLILDDPCCDLFSYSFERVIKNLK